MKPQAQAQAQAHNTYVHVMKALLKGHAVRYLIAAWPRPSANIWSLSPPNNSPAASTSLYGDEEMMKFPEFYERWIRQLEGHLRLLVAAPAQGEAEFEPIVKKLTAHHKEYYKMKWARAREDVLAFFAPEWLSPLESAYMWVTGWKPSMAFRLVESLRSLAGLSEEQARGIEELRHRIRAEEERVEREMERQQVAMADRKMVELARLQGPHSDLLVEGALKGLLAGLERVMKMADCGRLKTLKGVLDVLTPMQCVQFLAATSMLQIQMRKWGKIRNTTSSNCK